MRILEKSEIKAIFTNIDEMLSTNGDYALVDNSMEVQSMSIYTVKNGKLYDDISFDIEPRAYNESDIAELKEDTVGFKFALLAKEYNFSYPD